MIFLLFSYTETYFEKKYLLMVDYLHFLYSLNLFNSKTFGII